MNVLFRLHAVVLAASLSAASLAPSCGPTRPTTIPPVVPPPPVVTCAPATPVPASARTTTLQTSTGFYLTAEGGGCGLIDATRHDAGPWETFAIEATPEGDIALRTADGHYLTAENGGGAALSASRTSRGIWETFRPVQVDGGWALQTADGKHYLRAELGGGQAVNAAGPDASAWQTFLSSASLKAPPASAFAGPIHTDGKLFRNDAGPFRPLFASALTILQSGKPRDAFLDWVVAKGFNGIRVFAGALDFDGPGQQPTQAIANLPGLLDAARARGLYVEVTCLTNTASGYDKDAHVRAIAAIVAGRDNVLLEVANEPYHPTQSGLDVSRLKQLRTLLPASIPTALGAAADDESLDYSGGDFTTIHLDRARDEWNQVRRIREMQNVVDASGKPAMDNERIGAAEPGTPGQRLADPAFFLCAGALDRLFEIGGVFHFEDGLHVTVPVGPTQDAGADAYVRGFRTMDGYLHGQRSTYQNSNGHGGWGSSPVQNFDEARAARAYAGINGPNGGVVIVGGDDPGIVTIGAGWRLTGQSYGMAGCRALEIVH